MSTRAGRMPSGRLGTYMLVKGARDMSPNFAKVNFTVLGEQSRE